MPAWLDGLPRFPLLDGPSPLQPMPRLAAALGGRAELWVKREDLLPLAFGGNKLRNLEFLVGAALHDGSDTLVTSGRRWSNHCRLTAAAGARAGLDVHLVLGGPPGRDGPNAQVERLLGATIHVAATADREERDGLVDRVVAELRGLGRRPYVVGVGGTGVVGAAGQVLAGLELARQSVAAGATADVVVVPTATGGTQAGVSIGLALAGVRCRTVGIVVARPVAELRPVVERLIAELADLTGAVFDGPPELDERQLGDGYGRPTEAADEAMRLLARTEAILVDPIYTAKALAWLVAEVRAGQLDGRRVVFWHAGGTPGLFEPLDEV